MDTRVALLTAALKVLEDEGEAQFSTRAVCALANVTAPTLYHHYGRADGLLSAAMAEAFSQFLDSKRAAVKSTEPVTVLRGFASDTPPDARDFTPQVGLMDMDLQFSNPCSSIQRRSFNKLYASRFCSRTKS